MSAAGAQKAALICGPTASGKSALALELAREFGGVVINADSMQVYAELRIITSRPTAADEAAAPHRLYGFRPMREAYSTGLWLADVEAALIEARQSGRLPIIAGGTGLYFRALTEGLSPIPAIPEAIRAHYRKLAGTAPPEALYEELKRRDAATASRLRPGDTQRLVRALEVLEATKRPLAEWQAEAAKPLLPLAQTFPIRVTLGREELYRRCNVRVEAMIAGGAIEEARAIAALGLGPSLPAMRAVGLRPFMAHALGKLPLPEASELAKQETRNYAKRQITWIRRYFMSWSAADAQFLERTKSDLKIFIRSA